MKKTESKLNKKSRNATTNPTLILISNFYKRTYTQEECDQFELWETREHSFFKDRIPKYSIKATLSSLSTFGEIALSYTNRRTATIMASQDCTMLTLSKKVFSEVCDDARGQTANFLRFLKESFPGLSNSCLANLLCRLKERKMKLGTKLVNLGKIPESCYIIKTGHVKITSKFVKQLEVDDGELGRLRIRTPSTFPKKKVEISLVGPGSIIGDKEVLLGKKSNFDAVVVDEGSLVYQIKANEFSSLIKYNQKFFAGFLKSTNNRERFRVERKEFAYQGYKNAIIDQRTREIEVDDKRFQELQKSKIGSKFVRQFTNNLVSRNIQSKIMVYNQLNHDNAKNKDLVEFEVENFGDGQRKTNIAIERKMKTKKSLKRHKVKTGIKFSIETLLVKSVLGGGGRALNSSRMSDYSRNRPQSALSSQFLISKNRGVHNIHTSENVKSRRGSSPPKHFKQAKASVGASKFSRFKNRKNSLNASGSQKRLNIGSPGVPAGSMSNNLRQFSSLKPVKRKDFGSISNTKISKWSPKLPQKEPYGKIDEAILLSPPLETDSKYRVKTSSSRLRAGSSSHQDLAVPGMEDPGIATGPYFLEMKANKTGMGDKNEELAKPRKLTSEVSMESVQAAVAPEKEGVDHTIHSSLKYMLFRKGNRKRKQQSLLKASRSGGRVRDLEKEMIDHDSGIIQIKPIKAFPRFKCFSGNPEHVVQLDNARAFRVSY